MTIDEMTLMKKEPKKKKKMTKNILQRWMMLKLNIPGKTIFIVLTE
jgi:hypothetical protein